VQVLLNRLARHKHKAKAYKDLACCLWEGLGFHSGSGGVCTPFRGDEKVTRWAVWGRSIYPLNIVKKSTLFPLPLPAHSRYTLYHVHSH